MAEHDNTRTNAAGGGFVHATANDRFKAGFSNWFWGSLLAAVVVHFAMFAFWPEMSVADVSYDPSELEAIELPPEVKIPPPPEQIARPATPVVSASADIEEDITIAPTTFEDNPIENLPPPPTSSGDLSAAPTFTPYTVKPELKNRSEVQQALQRHYPPLLKDAGIGGTVMVWFFIDEEGRVQKTQVKDGGSGHDGLDNAALEVADVMRFSPALNRDKKVPVWVALPIVFEVR